MHGNNRKRSNRRRDEPRWVTLEQEEIAEVESTNDRRFGSVIDCTTLNVRKFPFKDAEIITTLSVQSTVEVDLDRSTEEFYKVCNAAGIEGFCIKRYIKLED